jgi:hypothetical protein
MVLDGESSHQYPHEQRAQQTHDTKFSGCSAQQYESSYVFTSHTLHIGYNEAARLGAFSAALENSLARYWDKAFSAVQIRGICERLQFPVEAAATKQAMVNRLVAERAKPLGTAGLLLPAAPPQLSGNDVQLQGQEPRFEPQVHPPVLPMADRKMDEAAVPRDTLEQLRGAIAINAILRDQISDLRRSAGSKPNAGSLEAERLAMGLYENLSKFLHRRREGAQEIHADDQDLQLGAWSLSVHGAGRAPRIKTLTGWLEAWSYYQAEFCTFHPHRIHDLHEHFRWMVKAPYSEEEKLAYDQALRAKHVGADAKWGELDMRLFSYHVGRSRSSTNRKGTKRVSTGAAYGATQTKKKAVVCRQFRDNGKCSYGQACRFSHACSVCGKGHFIKDCPVAKAAFSP